MFANLISLDVPVSCAYQGEDVIDLDSCFGIILTLFSWVHDCLYEDEHVLKIFRREWESFNRIQQGKFSLCYRFLEKFYFPNFIGIRCCVAFCNTAVGRQDITNYNICHKTKTGIYF